MTAFERLILDSKATRRVDAEAVARYGMSSLVLMENAGRGVTDVLERLGVDGRVVICCGAGNNGGDGFVVARHLDLRGYDSSVLLFTDPVKLQGDALANFNVLHKAGIEFEVVDPGVAVEQLSERFRGAAWIVDALLGTGARGAPRKPFDIAIRAMNEAPARRLAVDIPSGLDCDTGEAYEPTVRADHTCTFVARKPGFDAAGADRFTGMIHVLDIGAPRRLIEEIAHEASASEG